MKSLKYNPAILAPCILILGLLIAPLGLRATHIVGGEMTYKILRASADSVTLELTLSVYRDCFFGAADAPFDDPAFVGVYNRFNLLRRTLRLDYMGDDTLDGGLNQLCLVSLSPVCVHTSSYRTVISLRREPGGFTFAYQRCCRNVTVNNIINPLETGATYLVQVTDFAMNRAMHNSTPEFRTWPPVYVCVQQPLVFDHSAVDEDNDSLVYKLCTPFSGGTLANPQPMPAFPPPYDSILWLTGYGLSNMLGGAPGNVLTIDPVTGVMTANPEFIGQFVVGVCVEEYDRATGTLLSVVRRDFQYNVNQCGELTAAFFAPDVQCDNLTVTFENQSDNASTYQWFFDWPNSTPTLLSTDQFVQHTFPDTGTYTVTLIAEPGTGCADTFSRDIFLQFNSLDAEFVLNVFDCDTTTLLLLQDLSTDLVSPVVSWQWLVDYGGFTLQASVQNPTFEVPLGASGTITLTATSANGCVQTLTRTFTSGNESPGSLIEANLSACLGDSLNLNPNTPADIGFLYTWSPTTGLSDPNAVNPQILVTGPAFYSVTITPSVGGCEVIRTVEVTAVPGSTADFTNTPACDGLTIDFINQSANADTYAWDFGDPTTNTDFSSATNPSYAYPDTGTYVVTLIASTGGLCRDTFQRTVVINQAELSANFGISYDTCSPDSVVVRFLDESFNALNNTTGYSWTLSSGQTSTDQNPVFTFFANQTITVTFTVTTAEGCTNTMMQTVDIRLGAPVDQFPDELLACPGGSVSPLPGGDPAYTYAWTPAAGLDDPTSPAPVFSPAITTIYTVTVSAIGADTCVTTETLTVVVPPALNLAVTGDGVVCTPTTTLIASTDVPTRLVWTNANGDTLSTGASLMVNVSGPANYTVSATDINNCSESLTVLVNGGPVDLAVPDTVAACSDQQIVLTATNLDPNDTLTYSWTPAELFATGTANLASPDYLETVGQQTVTVTATNQFGCSVSEDVVVAVVDANAQLSFTSLLECNGATVSFTNTSTNAFGFVWDFGDGSAPSFETNPNHTYVAAGVYNVTLSLVWDVTGCAEPFTAPVTTLEPQLIADFTSDIIACSPEQAQVQFFDNTLSTFDITSWQWTFSSGSPANSSVQNPVLTLTQSGPVTVTLVINTFNNCSDSITRTLNIDLVQFDLPDTVVLCQGEALTLNPGGDPSLVYSWSPNVAINDPTAASPVVNPTVTTTYFATVYSTVGTDTCFINDSVVVFVPADLELDLGPAQVETCGEDVTLVAVTATAPAIVRWFSAVDGPLPSGPSVTVNPFRTDTITAIATDIYGCSDTASVVIIDNGVDIQLDIDPNVTACQFVDTTVTIVNLDDLDILTYNWAPAEFIVGPTNAASVTVVVDITGAVTFTGIATNQHGCQDTVQFTIQVTPFDGNLPETVQACANTPTPINPGGNPTYTYNWSPTTGLDLTQPWNPQATLTMSQLYLATITDPATGCNTVDSVQVDVFPDLDLQTDGDTVLCQIVPVTLTATTAVPGNVEWFVGASTTPTFFGSPIVVTPLNGDNLYTAIATDPTTGCRDTSLVMVEVQEFVDELPTQPLSVCPDEPTPINPGGDPNFVYSWSPLDEAIDLTNPWNPVVTTNVPRTYFVTVTDPVFGCTVIDTVQVDVFPAMNIEAGDDLNLCEIDGTVTLEITTDVTPASVRWLDAAGMQVGTGSPFVFSPALGENIYVVEAISSDGCTERDTVTVFHFPIDEFPLEPVVVCANTPTPINPGGNPDLVYVWTPADAAIDLTNPWNPVVTTDVSRSYVVMITDPVVGCTITDTVDIVVYPAMNIEAGDDLTLCTPDGTVTLSITSDTDPASVRWLNAAGVEVGTGSPLVITPAMGGNIYIAEALSVDGCTERDTVTVFNFPIQATLTPAQVICEPTATVDLSVTNLDPAQELEFEWDPTGIVTIAPGGATATVDPNITDEFFVTVVNQYGCSEELSTTVTVIDLVGDLSINAEPDTFLLGNSTTITVSGCVGCTYTWDVPSGDFTVVGGNGAVISATPTEGGSQVYEVTVDLLSCSVNLTAEVFVITAICDEDHVFLPNAFTPNGDGRNDVLRLRSIFLDEIIEMELMIYNRWGEEVFRTTDPRQGWDGTYRGGECAPDVFGFYLRVVCPDEEELIQQGNITLLR